VFKGIRAKLNCDNLSSAQCVEQYVRHIVVHEGHLAATLKNADHIEPVTLEIPFKQRISGNRVAIDETGANHLQRAANPLLVRAIVRAHSWLKSLFDGTYGSIEDLARGLDLHPKVVRKGLKLAFLSPRITKGILLGEQGGVRLLRDLELATALGWHQQSQAARQRGVIPSLH
jgi:site-specific DNA recombinase